MAERENKKRDRERRRDSERENHERERRAYIHRIYTYVYQRRKVKTRLREREKSALRGGREEKSMGGKGKFRARVLLLPSWLFVFIAWKGEKVFYICACAWTAIVAKLIAGQ